MEALSPSPAPSSSRIGSITPRRRTREESDAESQQTDHQDAVGSQGHKCQRVRNDEDGGSDGDDAGAENEDGPLLPDSFRRSPKGKGRARDAIPNDDIESHDPKEHQPGSIVRVLMKTFVTYTYAEFLPGPNLNMIIGPNGTGKSTLVCAICLGLGCEPKHLGRAKDIAEFVKHGAKDATIEIELKADPDRHETNPIINCKINRDGGKSDDKKTSFLINGKKSTKRAVLELVRSFSIQVDNLCQFLPQDRVVEFASLSPVELLVQTQRAAAPDYMSEWHEKLKADRKKQKQISHEYQTLVESLKNLEVRQRNQAETVESMRQRAELQQKVALLEKMRPVAEYTMLKRRHIEAKTRRLEAVQELAELQRRVEPNLKSMDQKKTYLEQVLESTGRKTRLLGRTQKRTEDLYKTYEQNAVLIQSCEDEVQAEKASAKKAREDNNKLQNQIRSIEAALKSPPDPFDPEAINERSRRIAAEISPKDGELDGINDQLETLKTQQTQRKHLIEEEEKKKLHLQSQAGRLTSKLGAASQASAKVWEWIQNHRDQFRSEVFGPPMIECSVSGGQHHADWVESCMGRGELLAFTVTCKEDFDMLSSQVFSEMRLHDVSIRNVTQRLADFTAPMSADVLRQQFGLDGWLRDLVEGPEPVLAMLCDNRALHMTAYCSKETDEAQYKAIKASPLGAWATPSSTYLITRRKDYGDAATARSNPIKKASLLTDAPVDMQAEQDSDRRIGNWRIEMQEIREEIQGLEVREVQVRTDVDRLTVERNALKAEKQDKQRKHAEFQGLQTKLDNMRGKLEDVKAQLGEVNTRIGAIRDKQVDLVLKKGQQAIDLALSIRPLRGQHEDMLVAELVCIEARSDYEQLKLQYEDESQALTKCQDEVDALRSSERDLYNMAHEKKTAMQHIFADCSEEDTEMYQQVQDKEPPELETDIEQAKAQLDMQTNVGTARTIAEYEERAVKIDQKRIQKEEIEQHLEDLRSAINEIQTRWEPQLDELIRQISEAFAENFQKIQCAGEVAVRKDEDFEQWAIQIKVKFRETEDLSVLDAHRQSGGERAVSTIFYLMALQSLARAPFRVVDEINQGMDPRNERLVHSRMVDIACQQQASQYFLITPKLLNGLKYHERMKVHCIASGEYMPESGRNNEGMGTFEELAARALAVRAG